MTTQHSNNATQSSGNATLTGWIQLVLVTAVLIGALAINRLLAQAAATPVQRPPEPSVAVVETFKPDIESAVIRVTETGTIRARANVSVVPQVSGRIVEVAPEFATGGMFREGQVLFSIDPTDFELAVRQAQADFDSAQSGLRLELAQATTAEGEWSLINGDKPIPPLVARKPQIAQAQAVVAAAQARLDEAHIDLARTRYSLPFDGRVVATTIETGQTVVANQSYGDVYRSSALEAYVSVSSDALVALEPVIGRNATVLGQIGKQIAHIVGRVVRMEAELDSHTRLAGLIIDFDEPPGFLPGAFVEVDIAGDEVSDVYRLPADLIAAGDVVWVVRNNALATRRPAILSRREGVVIVGQFDIGEGIVTTLPVGARDGLPVTVAGPVTPAPLRMPTSSPTAIAGK